MNEFAQFWGAIMSISIPRGFSRQPPVKPQPVAREAAAAASDPEDVGPRFVAKLRKQTEKRFQHRFPPSNKM